jgi:hypothetical protein
VKDILGREATPAEKRLLRTLKSVEALLSEPDFPPCALANAREAYAALWIAANDLGLVAGKPDVVVL